MDDVPVLLRRAADLVPPDARSDVGLGADDVRGYLLANEWEVALDILEDFDGIQWQTIEFWGLLAGAARQMQLSGGAAWHEWRKGETLHGIIRADLQLVAPGAGGRRTPVPRAGQPRPMWAISHPVPPHGADLHVARIWVESATEIRPGEQGAIRLAPLTPAHWRRTPVRPRQKSRSSSCRIPSGGPATRMATAGRQCGRLARTWARRFAVSVATVSTIETGAVREPG